MPQLEWNRGKGKWEKQCSSCKEIFEVVAETWDAAREALREFFYGYNNQSRRDVHTSGDDLQSRCKECHSHTVHKRKHNGLKREDILIVQSGKCAICNNEISFDDKTAAVDHNHSTREIRAILCHSCNHGIGHFRENIDYMKKAIAYLEKYRG